MNDEKEECCGFRESTCRGLWQTVSSIFIVLALITVIINVALNASRDSQHRTCGIATGTEVFLATGVASADPTARIHYQIEFDADGNQIRFLFVYNTSMTSGLTAAHLRGPIGSGGSLSGPLVGSLCGFPGEACDSVTSPGTVQGAVTHEIKDGVHVNGIDIRPVILAYREFPTLYYVEFLSNAAPTSPGAARGQLAAQCGYL